MVEIKVLITTNTEPIKEVGKALKETTTEFERLNKVVISTFQALLKDLQRDIKRTELDIKKLKSDLEQDLSTLKLREKELISLISQQELKDLEKAVNIINSLSQKGAPDSLLVEILRRLEPDNIKNSFKELVASIKIFDKKLTEGLLEDAIEHTPLEDFLGFAELSPDGRKAVIERLEAIREEIKDIEDERERIAKELLPELDPLAFEIISKQENIKELRQNIEQQNQVIKENELFLEELINDRKEAIKQLENLGVEIPDSGLKLEFNEIIPEGLQNKLEEHKDTIKNYHAELETGNKVVTEYEGSFKHLEGAVAMAGEGLVAGAGAQSEFAQSTKGTVNQLKNESEKITNLDPNLQSLAKRNDDVAQTQEQVNQAVGESGVVYDGASKSVEAYGDTVEEVQNKGGFFEGIKQGFIDFVENVQSNSELMADFFADTLSQMSQSFSDLFFNVITGRFDDLKDLAKQAFEAILRAFLDLVSAIATRQIVISIGGLFGIGKGAQAAGGGSNALQTGTQAAGLFSSGAGLFGSTGAFATLGAGLGLSSSAAFTTAAGGGTALLGTGSFAAGGAVGAQAAQAAAVPGFFATAGAAITIVGAALAAAALVATIILPLLKKTPKYAFKFESIETEVGERAATVAEFLDADLFSEEIFKTLSSHGGGGAFSGKERDELKKAIQKAIAETINSVQDIINKLPEDMAKILNEALLSTTVDTTTKIGRSNLLGFDAKGAKEIKERLEKFFQGDLQGRFLFAIRDFFQIAFEQLGVLPDKAAAFIDTEFERFKNAKSPEERAQIGQEFLASFNAFVDAFNIVSGNVNDAIGQTIQSVRSLSQELGFDAVPSIGELTDKLGELLENAELDPETVQKYADLRNAIVQGISDIINSISGLIGKISQLNSTIVGLGGAAVNIIPFLDQAQAALLDFYTTNIGNLSLGEQETFLDEILGIANAKLAEEQAAFQRAQAARQRAEEAQRERIQKRIDNLNKEKDKINEVFQKRIEALNEELQIAESFAQLTESIRQTLDSILFSPESVLTGVEQVNALQSNIANLQAQLASTADPEKQLEIAGRLEEAFKTLFDTAGDAFGVNSPEFVAIFDQVTGGLENLAGFTEGQGRSVEEISAEIERLTAENEATLKSIDAKIEAAQERLANIGQSTADNTFRASQELTELFEFIRSEYIRILEERFAELEEVSEFGFATETEGLSVIAGLTDESLTVLKGVGEETVKQTGYLADIAGKLGTLAGFQHGSEGFRDFGRGTLAVLHGFEAVVTKRDIAAVQDSILHQIAGGGISGLAERLAGEGDGCDGLTRGGFIAGLRPGGGFVPGIPVNMTGPETDEPVNHVTEMSVDINVNVNGGSQASLASLAGEIENMMVRSIRQGRVRKELQEAAVRRVG